MSTTPHFASVTFATALGCGLAAGVFFAFSTFVMPALARLPAPQGIAAMQSINVAAVRPAFMSALFGTALACLVLALSANGWPGPARGYVLAAAVLYLAGTIAVTIVFNVPLNNQLAAVDPRSGEAGALWERYLRVWTTWNHVRAAAALAAAACLIQALRLAVR